MALSIKDEEADRLAREIARRTGESLTQAVVISLRERLARLPSPRQGDLEEEIARIARRNAARKVLDPRSEDEILGYDASGSPASW
jgi:antitoxin VapB